MRRLIVTRGLPGSGKSSLIASLGLGGLVLSPDVMRSQISGPMMSGDGLMETNQEDGALVWASVMELLRRRMKRGDTVVLDATHAKLSEMGGYVELAREHLYELAVLDLSRLDPEVVVARNVERPEPYRVPAASVNRMWKSMCNETVLEGARLIDGLAPLADIRHAMESFMDDKPVDANAYSRVVHVGDLHGCDTAFEAILARTGGPRDDDLWVLAGDTVDRGPQNGRVLRRVMELAQRPNVVPLWGNHEDHLLLWGMGRPAVSREFEERSLPQILAEGITPDDALALLRRTRDVFSYQRGDETVTCTHAGLPRLPDALHQLSSRQFSHGPGNYETDVDAAWDAWSETNSPEGQRFVQVHGHRNSHDRAVIEGRSINLEGKVEFGGDLRAVVHDQSGWHNVSVRNADYLPWRERRHRPNDLVPPWMVDGVPSGLNMPEADLEAMLDHSGVKAKPMPDAPHIISLNFTRNVFWDKAWDDVVVKARGLFVNAITREIVSRSYDKFFNAGEVEGLTDRDSLLRDTQPPYRLWRKENGFLGLTGYDAQTDSLFVASKSTSAGDFSDMVREIVVGGMRERAAGLPDEFRRTLRDLEACCVFEVIDPVRDPHMVEYDRPHAVLLDVLARSERFQCLPYDDLVKFGKRFGFPVKAAEYRLPNRIALAKWLERSATDMSVLHEGWVVEDARGFNFKVKSPQYAFWKWMRGACESIQRSRKVEAAALNTRNPTQGRRFVTAHEVQKAEVRGLGFLAPKAEAFMDWAQTLDDSALSRDIITLRKEFMVLHPEVDMKAGTETEASRPRR